MTDTDDDSSVCDGDFIPHFPDYQYWYMFRFTPINQEVTFDDVLGLPFISSGVCAREFSQNDVLHFHTVFGTDVDLKKNKKFQNDNFSKILYDTFNVPEDEYDGKKLIKRYRGNTCYDLQYIKDIHKGTPYSLKDGDYSYTEDMADIASYWFQMSYPKPLGYKKDRKILIQKYMDDEIDVQTLWCETGCLRSKYDLEVSYEMLDRLTLSAMGKKDPLIYRRNVADRKLFS